MFLLQVPEKLSVLYAQVVQSIVPCYLKTSAELRSHQMQSVFLENEKQKYAIIISMHVPNIICYLLYSIEQF